jgi:hypothetical protein
MVTVTKCMADDDEDKTQDNIAWCGPMDLGCVGVYVYIPIGTVGQTGLLELVSRHSDQNDLYI